MGKMAMFLRFRSQSLLALWACVFLLSGCAGGNVDDSDPFEPLNRAFYTFNDTLERNFLRPVSTVYLDVAPEPVRDGVRNFFDNLQYPGVFLNNILQGKFEQGMADMGRFIINSTFGLGGLVDFASAIGLERHDEDFGQTLAVWGFSEGGYLELPLLGPKTLRDVPGIPVSSVTNVLFYTSAASVGFPLSLLDIIDEHSRLLTAIKLRDETALDPYIFQREAYRQRRRHLIYDGNRPADSFDDLDELEEESQ